LLQFSATISQLRSAIEITAESFEETITVFVAGAKKGTQKNTVREGPTSPAPISSFLVIYKIERERN